MRLPRKIRFTETDGPKLKICSGQVREPLSAKLWLPLYHFLVGEGSYSDDETDAFYNAFHECIENVRQHAFSRSSQSRGRWYAVALRPDTSVGRIVIVDLGRGIPASLKKVNVKDVLVLLGDVFKSFVAETLRWTRLTGIEEPEVSAEDLFRGMLQDEVTRVWLATQGMRTETGSPERGTGLNSLRAAVKRSGRGGLHVSSGGAMVSYVGAKDKATTAQVRALPGTVVCLELGPARGNVDV